MPDETTTPRPFPAEGPLLGVDFGKRRLGFAVSMPEHTMACPLENYDRCGDVPDAIRLRDVVADYGIVGVVVGLPLHTAGEEGESARRAREFGEWVGRATGLPVCHHDERFTTALAEDHLLHADLSRKNRHARRDKLAAQIMLQSYLDAAAQRAAR